MREHFTLEPLDVAKERAADDVLWTEAIAKLGVIELDGQMMRVGASCVYDDRPRYWVMSGTKVYASFA